MGKSNAVILAAGIGYRLQPFTIKKPKALITIGNLPILEHQVKLLAHQNFKNILIVTWHLEDLIKSRAKQWQKYGINVSFVSVSPKGTCLALYRIRNLVANNFVLLYCDIMTSMKLSKLATFHNKKRADLSIVSHVSNHPWDSDLLKFDGDRKLINIFRNQDSVQTKQYSASGIFMVHKSILKKIQVGLHMDMVKDFIPSFKNDKNSRIYVYVTSEYMKDIGTIERLREVRKEYTNNF